MERRGRRCREGTREELIKPPFRRRLGSRWLCHPLIVDRRLPSRIQGLPVGGMALHLIGKPAHLTGEDADRDRRDGEQRGDGEEEFPCLIMAAGLWAAGCR